MARNYTVKLPDGSEYGPIDLETLQNWYAEGRVGGDCWAWPDEGPDWILVSDVLKGAPGPSAASAPAAAAQPAASRRSPPGMTQATARAAAAKVTAVLPKDRSPARQAGAAGTAADPQRDPGGATLRPAEARAARSRAAGGGARPASRDAKWVYLGMGGALLLLVLVFAARAVLLPMLQEGRAASRLRAEAREDGRYADESLGLLLEARDGWVVLKDGSSVLVAPLAKARLAHESGAFATLTVEALPPGVLPLDRFLDRVVDSRRSLVSAYQESARSDAVVGGRPGRRLSASWTEGGAPQRVEILAVRDAWVYVAVTFWGPEAAGDELSGALDSLAAGLSVAGTLESRVRQTAGTLLADFPELTPNALELLVRAGGSPEASLDGVATRAVQAVSRGLAGLPASEVRELRQIYDTVYEPMNEADRQRLAAWQAAAREEQAVPAPEVLEVRRLLTEALLVLPEETRLRLQALNEKAIAASFERG